MTAIDPTTPVQRRVVKVAPDVIAAAQLRETLDELLGRKTSPVIAKIARAQRARPAAD